MRKLSEQHPGSPATPWGPAIMLAGGGIHKLSDQRATGSVGGATVLNDLTDVNIGAPSNGDVLTWDSTPGEWVAQAPGASSGGVPVGGIIMWSGTIATIPATWALCDGAANSPGPDLRDKFVVGAKQDDAGVAKSNILGSLSQSGGATGHSHSGHGNLSHAGGAVGDHTGFTHGLSVANHPDLTHAAIGDHASYALTHPDHASAVDISVASQAIASLANLSRPALAHSHASAVDISIASQVIASGTDISIASHTVSVPSQAIASAADISIASFTMAQASAAGVASFASGTNRSGLTARAAYTHTIPAHTGTRPSLAVVSVAGTASAITGSRPSLAVAAVTGSRPELAATNVSGADISMPSLPVVSMVGSRPALSHASHSVAALTHGGAGSHIGTDYGVHSFTAPPAHGTAGTVTHSFTQPSDHSLSAHDTVSMVPSFFALAFIQRMS